MRSRDLTRQLMEDWEHDEFVLRQVERVFDLIHAFLGR